MIGHHRAHDPVAFHPVWKAQRLAEGDAEPPAFFHAMYDDLDGQQGKCRARLLHWVTIHLELLRIERAFDGVLPLAKRKGMTITVTPGEERGYGGRTSRKGFTTARAKRLSRGWQITNVMRQHDGPSGGVPPTTISLTEEQARRIEHRLFGTIENGGRLQRDRVLKALRR
jgi:hypothetical protein